MARSRRPWSWEEWIFTFIVVGIGACGEARQRNYNPIRELDASANDTAAAPTEVHVEPAAPQTGHVPTPDNQRPTTASGVSVDSSLDSGRDVDAAPFAPASATVPLDAAIPSV